MKKRVGTWVALALLTFGFVAGILGHPRAFALSCSAAYMVALATGVWRPWADGGG